MAANADRYYAVRFIVFDLEKMIKNYKNFLDIMRGLPRAEPNDGKLPSGNLTNVILIYKEKRVVLKLNTDDFFVNGFVANDGRLWEFRREVDLARLRGSSAVGIRVNYPPLIGLRISKNAILKAFGELAGMVQGKRIAYSAAVLCLVFCESARFSWASHTFRRCVSSSKQWIEVELWLDYVIKNWAKLTRLARECNEESIVLNDAQRRIVVNRDYSYFCKLGTQHRVSQARIAKFYISQRLSRGYPWLSRAELQ